MLFKKIKDGDGTEGRVGTLKFHMSSTWRFAVVVNQDVHINSRDVRANEALDHALIEQQVGDSVVPAAISANRSSHTRRCARRRGNPVDGLLARVPAGAGAVDLAPALVAVSRVHFILINVVKDVGTGAFMLLLMF